MRAVTVRLPDSLHRVLGDLARQEGVSVNQFIITAVAERIATLKTIDSLKERASRGSRKAFATVLAKVPNAPPVPGDELVRRAGRRKAPSVRAR